MERPMTTKKTAGPVCKKCHGADFKSVGTPLRKMIEGFDERAQVHYRGVEWIPLECTTCGQRTKRRTLIPARSKGPAKETTKSDAPTLRKKTCANSAPTLRTKRSISTKTDEPVVTIRSATRASDYTATQDDGQQHRSNPKNSRDTAKRRN